jgi:glycolate oxidase
MALSTDAYRALEDIVGPKYISQDPAVMDSYAYQWLAETVRPNRSKFMTRPEAALLPGSTREVQAIVRICNKYKIKFKAYSTGWYFYGAPLSEGVIQLDMRRMDHILEIDEKNMFAVIEPYVIAGVLQAEVMKRGLNCTVTGAGASCATLVGATCYHGAAAPQFTPASSGRTCWGRNGLCPMERY